MLTNFFNKDEHKVEQKIIFNTSIYMHCKISNGRGNRIEKPKRQVWRLTDELFASATMAFFRLIKNRYFEKRLVLEKSIVDKLYTTKAYSYGWPIQIFES